MSAGAERHRVVARLREEIRRIERRPARRDGSIACGRADIDALLPDGGFRRGALTELAGGPASGKTAIALALFAALGPGDARRLCRWPGELYPPAAAALGVDLARLLVVRTRRRAMREVQRETRRSPPCGPRRRSSPRARSRRSPSTCPSRARCVGRTQPRAASRRPPRREEP